ncbi:hypothetical protein HOY82DRAFT_399759 [Tuber indicum]|nr:hypothetical protein HOY82DRAFT_399759 [Tuber indicum]
MIFVFLFSISLPLMGGGESVWWGLMGKSCYSFYCLDSPGGFFSSFLFLASHDVLVDDALMDGWMGCMIRGSIRIWEVVLDVIWSNVSVLLPLSLSLSACGGGVMVINSPITVLAFFFFFCVV